jgi:hypothetical protein
MTHMPRKQLEQNTSGEYSETMLEANDLSPVLLEVKRENRYLIKKVI